MLRSVRIVANRSRLAFVRGYSVQPSKSLKSNTIQSIREKYLLQSPITVSTAHDYITSSWAHAANCDMILVGDSLAMTTLGYESTTDISFEEFKYHVRSVCRASGPSMVIVDMPFGTFESSIQTGIANAIDIMKLSNKVASVKVEVGPHTRDRYTLRFINELCSRGIPVIGHCGLTPQRVHSLGGFKVQGNKNIEDIKVLCETAAKLEEAGCWALLLECIPHKVASYITASRSVPTIGIGAGPSCSGQVLVISDMLGMREGSMPRFVKQYGNMRAHANESLSEYVKDVQEKRFPDKELHTFKIKEDLWKSFLENVNKNKNNH
ncbi:ECM31 (YBR176W) [Zygosaccharomyces parabailii]|uniref:3-methyl-2-oxobutanoate hydroxymethyltransferase n=1 Tax=Zygosaccharomyces bailii (strain CLIB 213 / ATCC 58445 / CBS 680 / BCRC 21525 / NBRC 1098 / NCYC 1416 / NRRL Y-2227) TaxID=1333698 RepID=A0A8J2X3G5_ZYGB2|nr:ECM31 (YBR176W) [Zygosaccharomyces parabailii]CDF90875.1 ZYBA0S08-05226g1_1 [Zygosaccharomyces bailii CLIB 213]CDH16872.1 probable 3-methyl-2-oxobutanoate hydroxymethyltransferase [Zygosaccharomyces bailii ISA1307]SJM85526.1 probable 3-methyl-2-oxobutanoate hydroxymethyltransferase [Zygosaccharomyces bailii]